MLNILNQENFSPWKLPIFKINAGHNIQLLVHAIVSFNSPEEQLVQTPSTMHSPVRPPSVNVGLYSILTRQLVST